MGAAIKAQATKSVTPATRRFIASRARRELCRHSLYEFLKASWNEMEPGVEFEDNWHIYAFCLHVQAMFEGWLVANGHGTKWMEANVRKAWEQNGIEYKPGKLLVQNLVMNLPPITLKSKILMVVAPAWMWLHCPSWSVCAISAVNDNVKRDSNAHRELVESEWYRETFLRKADGTIAWSIKKKQESVEQWANTSKGERKSRTMQSGYTGVHVNCFPGETMVSTERGPMRIDELHAMDPDSRPLVLSRNHGDAVHEYRRIRATREIEDRPLVELITQDGRVIRSTPDHQFFTDRGYLEAEQCAGRQLMLDDGGIAVVAWVATNGARAAVYDLDVEGNHNFFAGGVLAHNCLLLDDPEDAHAVHSEAYRKNGQFKWVNAIKNRVKHLERDIRIAIQQRVHLDDWTNAQISKAVWSPQDRKAWAWVVMPLEYGAGPDDAPQVSPWGWFDPRAVANDNMQPSRFSDELIVDEKRDKGEEGFQAQYNQRPAALDMGLIKRRDVRFFRIEDDAPATMRPHGCGIHPDTGEWVAPVTIRRSPETGALELDEVIMSIDASNGSEALTASAQGVGVIGRRGMERFILDDVTKVMGPDEMYQTIENTLNAWPEISLVLVELKAAGSSVIARINEMIRDGRIKDRNGDPRVVVTESYNPKQDSKEARAIAMQPDWRQGLVYVRDGARWLFPIVVSGGRAIDDGYVGEITSFPRSKKNDRVDYTGQALAFFRPRSNPHEKWKALSRTSWG